MNSRGPADDLRKDGATVILVAIDGKAAGLIAIADPVKELALGAVKALRDEGVRVVMLTGDNQTTAEAVARRLGISDIRVVLPANKSAIVEGLRKQGRIVAMAGDGVNDAPALAAADVGIAMGTGTDVAIESAGVTLLKGDLKGIVRARHLSEAMMRNIRENLFFAFIYNAAGVRSPPGFLSDFWHPSVTCHRGCRDVALLSQRDWQCPAAAHGEDRMREVHIGDACG